MTSRSPSSAKRSAPAPRRSRLDVRLGRLLTIGQRWRQRSDGEVWRVRQVHRLDCVADLEHETRGGRLTITFQDLRRDWTWIAEQQQEAA